MKNAFLVAGIGAGAYGLYLLLNNTKKKGCGCTGSSTAAIKPIAVVNRVEDQLYPDQAIDSFSTQWRSLFPTPTRLGQGPLSIHNTDTFSGAF